MKSTRNVGCTLLFGLLLGMLLGSVGQVQSSAFRWTIDDGMVDFGSLNSVANGVSSDGSIIVGNSDLEAFRWTIDDGIVGLGFLYVPGHDSFLSFANDVSSDGSTVVGNSNSTPVGGGIQRVEAFRWTANDGMIGLGDLPGGGFFSRANGVSSDGSVVVGVSESSQSGSSGEAFRWTADDGMIGLGSLYGPYSSRAVAASSDGSVIVGDSSFPTGREAFRWTADDGMIGLGDLPGGEFASIAQDISSDSSVIVGHSRSSLGIEAFIWDSVNGMQRLSDILTAGGLDLTGWDLEVAQAVSADGKIIAGYGDGPNGKQQAWLADLTPTSPIFMGLGFLPDGGNSSAAFDVSANGSVVVGWAGKSHDTPEPIPEPSTIALMTCGLLGLLGIGVKRRRKAK